jgi:hypothetical protein
MKHGMKQITNDRLNIQRPLDAASQLQQTGLADIMVGHSLLH